MIFCASDGVFLGIEGWGYGAVPDGNAVVSAVTEGRFSIRCNTCGEKAFFTLDGKKEHVHSYAETVTQEAGCLSEGVKTFTCTAGDDSYTQPIPALGHDLDEGVVSSEPNCGNDGVKTYTCLRCCEKITETLPASGDHSYISEITREPNCGTTGVKTFTCSVCGDTYTEELPVVGEHSYSDSVTTPAGCETEGVRTFECSGCGHTYTEPIPANGHIWDDGRVSKEPNCSDPGERLFTCEICEAERTEAIGINSAVHVEGTPVTVAPTCTAQGYTETRCTLCNKVLLRENFQPANGHAWNEGTVTAAPTCVSEGVMTLECTVCHTQKTEAIAATPNVHDYEIHSVPATCTSEGVDTYTCKNCGRTETVTHPAAHSYGDPTEEPAATCGAPGTRKWVCENCGDVKTEVIEATGNHDWLTLETTATCTEAGEKQQQCSVCGKCRTVDDEALGHEWDEGEQTKAPSCTEEGMIVYTCIRGCQETQILAMTEHAYDPQTHICASCGETYPEVQNILAKYGVLIDPEQITDTNALAEYNKAKEIQSLVREIQNSSSDANQLKEALAANYTEEMAAKVAAVIAASEKYLQHTAYRFYPGQDSFRVIWNDNTIQEANSRPQTEEEFLNAAEVSLSYRIRSSDGSVVVAEGTLANMADAESAFERFWKRPDSVAADAPLVVVTMEDAVYTMANNENLPKRYTAVYTDYATGLESEQNFVIEYSVTMKNPVPEDYILTKPVRTQDPVTIANGASVTLTRLAEWAAFIEWEDDNNRSADGGNALTNRPRVDAATLKAASTVYQYRQGYNVADGVPVTGEFGYEINEENGVIRLTGLPAYDDSGSRLVYYISQEKIPAANDAYVPGDNHYSPHYKTKAMLRPRPTAFMMAVL